MKKKYALFILIISILFLCIFFLFKKGKQYDDTFLYFDTLIEVKYKGKKDYKKEIEELFLHYHNLTTRYEEYGNNVYGILHNKEESETLELNPDLYEMLEYAQSFKEKSDGKYNIELGCVFQLWKDAKEKETIPSIEELQACENHPLILLGNNKILNNHPNLDLGSFAKGYAVQKLGEFFQEKEVKDYLINAGGNVLVGTPSNKTYYRVGIQNPDNSDLLKILNVKEKAVVTSGGYERFYEYDGVKYHHIIDPGTLFPAKTMKSVTVIASDSGLADILSTTLFLMTEEEGKEFLKDYSDVDVIWVTNENEVITTKGVSNYE